MSFSPSTVLIDRKRQGQARFFESVARTPNHTSFFLSMFSLASSYEQAAQTAAPLSSTLIEEGCSMVGRFACGRTKVNSAGYVSDAEDGPGIVAANA